MREKGSGGGRGCAIAKIPKTGCNSSGGVVREGYRQGLEAGGWIGGETGDRNDGADAGDRVSAASVITRSERYDVGEIGSAAGRKLNNKIGEAETRQGEWRT